MLDDMRRPPRLTARPGVPPVRAVERAVALLRAFAPERPRLGLSELARAAGLDKGTARRLLLTLAAAGLVEFDERAQLYRLGADVLGIAAAVEAGRDLREVAAPVLTDVTEKTGATAFLWVHHDGTALCVERVRAPLLRIDATWFTVGARAFLNCGGGPRVLLAYITEEEREAALAGELPQRTPASETDPARLREAARTIRARGWELAVDDFFVGLAALGVPILDRRGAFVGALSITGLTAGIVEDGRPRHLDILLGAATRIGEQLR
ncbi:IclR family transcriptional regulator [Chelatococcus sp. SYSU_G07232]|uniref:IclR family transcriptional regulator n=1 Tax=Chelatococcus albus TaxID=3047466 RepID=A0ABT7AIH2_9HYPH|nr:IclR family transcriptional regulator [Chelatococcus sp. SYSU_G07232]MDJ1159182.1 IclR family transcriptional regulator [Chelatococcus sp. SYSU_G07232]